MSGILREWPLSLKTAKLLNMALHSVTNFDNIANTKKNYFINIVYRRTFFLFYNFCCKVETVDFCLQKIRQICQNVPNVQCTVHITNARIRDLSIDL